MTEVEFTDKERAYLQSQDLAHIATVASDDPQPDVAPVGFEFDNGFIHVGGINLRNTLKYHNVHDNPMVAVVIDDLEEGDLSKPRGVKIHGRAVTTMHGGREMITITPLIKWSWGINQPTFVDGDYILERSPG